MKQITALGDSIIRGVVPSTLNEQNGNKYSILDNSFSTRCSSTLGLNIKNHGRFGNTVRKCLRDLERRKDLIATSDFVVMEVGGNDCDHHWEEIATNPNGLHNAITPLEEFATQYHSLIDGIRALGSRPIVLSLPPIIPDLYFNTITQAMNPLQKSNIMKWLGGSTDSISRWHEMYNVRLFKMASKLSIPIIDITTPFLEIVDIRPYFCPDGIHPNEEGHRLIAETICRVAKPILG